MPEQFYYILSTGEIDGSNSTRIDPPDTGHQDYVDGAHSDLWKEIWVRRLDGSVVGYPEDGQFWNFVSAWYWPKVTLKRKSRERRQVLILATTITYGGKTISTDVDKMNILGTSAQKARFEDPADHRGFLYDNNQNTLDLTNAQFLEVADAVLEKRQNIIDADVAVCNQIDANTITTPTEVDTAFAAYMASPATRDSIDVSLFDWINEVNTALAGKQATITQAAHIADAATGAATNLATNYGALTSLLTLASALNTANAAQNDLGTKYNDLAAKYNTLMDHLETQGLQHT